jgi:hypothetical protein
MSAPTPPKGIASHHVLHMQCSLKDLASSVSSGPSETLKAPSHPSTPPLHSSSTRAVGKTHVHLQPAIMNRPKKRRQLCHHPISILPPIQNSCHPTTHLHDQHHLRPRHVHNPRNRVQLPVQVRIQHVPHQIHEPYPRHIRPLYKRSDRVRPGRANKQRSDSRPQIENSDEVK